MEKKWEVVILGSMEEGQMTREKWDNIVGEEKKKKKGKMARERIVAK